MLETPFANAPALSLSGGQRKAGARKRARTQTEASRADETSSIAGAGNIIRAAAAASLAAAAAAGFFFFFFATLDQLAARLHAAPLAAQAS